MVKAAPGEMYTVRTKVFKILGGAFHVYDADGNVVAYCKQKAFKLKEDFRLYTDTTCSQELLRISARSVIDFGATYDVTTADGQTRGSLRRKGLKSMFKDSWLVFDPAGQEYAQLAEDSTLRAMLRRFVDGVTLFMPQRFHLIRHDGTPIAQFRQHMNPFIYRLGVTIEQDDEHLDDLMLLATAVLISAIEGRQN